LDLLELAFDGLLVRGRRRRLLGTAAVGGSGAIAGSIVAAGRRGRLVRRRRHALERLRERRHAGLHRLDVGALEGLPERGDLVLGLDLVLGIDLVAEVLERPLTLEREGLGLVAGLDLLAPLLVLVGVLLGV